MKRVVKVVVVSKKYIVNVIVVCMNWIIIVV